MTYSVDDRPLLYKEDVCWQYNMRKENFEQDVCDSGMSDEEIDNLRVSDFVFDQFTKEDERYPVLFPQVKKFIERHEWLGKMSLYPTHYFFAIHKETGILSGVVVMDVPAAFSKLLGEDTRKIERLISRGACISWSPKNLASSLIMHSIKWMVDNTRFRLFSAYSDPEAKELGTIYQACNFYYINKKYGTTKKYRYPNTTKWFSDRSFRTRSAYKRYAKSIGIEWEANWNKGSKMLFENMPSGIEEQLRVESKKQYEICESRVAVAKHKYCYILGKNKTETKHLKKAFSNLNDFDNVYKYPKDR